MKSEAPENMSDYLASNFHFLEKTVLMEKLVNSQTKSNFVLPKYAHKRVRGR